MVAAAPLPTQVGAAAVIQLALLHTAVVRPRHAAADNDVASFAVSATPAHLKQAAADAVTPQHVPAAHRDQHLAALQVAVQKLMALTCSISEAADRPQHAAAALVAVCPQVVLTAVILELQNVPQIAAPSAAVLAHSGAIA